MTPTPVSPPTTVRPPPSAGTDRDTGRVRPLPSTEPAPGVPGAVCPTDRECVVTPSARPVPAPERGVPVPARPAALQEAEQLRYWKTFLYIAKEGSL